MPAGRPTKLTPAIQQEIATWLMGGHYVETVCNYVGIDRKTFYNWMAWGKRGWAKDQKAGYTAFYFEMLRAMATAEIQALQAIMEGKENWQSRAWFLERREASRWNLKVINQFVGPDDGPIQVEEKVSITDAERAERIMKILETARARIVEQSADDK